jgi:hypothetical protein
MKNLSDTNKTSKIKGLRIKIRALFRQNGFLRKYTNVFLIFLEIFRQIILKLFAADI